MADWSKIKIDIDGNSQTVDLPEYAKESTQNDMYRILQKISGIEKEELDQLKGIHKESLDNKKVSKENAEKVAKSLDKVSEATKKSSAGFEAGLTKAGGKIGGLIGNVALTLGGAFLTAVTVTAGKVGQLGAVFNDLTKTGLLFDEAQSKTALQQITSFNRLGLSTEQAANFMMDNAQVSRTLQGRLSDVTSEFLQLTNYGGKLGLALNDSISMFSEELSARTQYLNLGRLEESQRTRMVNNIEDTTRKQIKYANALGVSVDAMQSFVRGILDDNGAFASALLRVPTMARENLLKGATDFLGTMRALGGEVGGELGAATLEAATFGALGFSDAAMGFVTVLPSLAGTMNNAISEFESGVLDGAKTSEIFAEQLGNLSNTERDRVFAFARAGDETAKELAKAIVQFEQSAKRLTEINKDLDVKGVQAGFNTFNVIMKRLGTIFDTVMNTFMQGFGMNLDTVSQKMTDLSKSVLKFINTALGDADKGLINFGKRMGEKVAEFVDYIDGFMTALTDSGTTLGELGEIIFDASTKMLENIKNAFVDGLVDGLTALFTHPDVIKAFVLLLSGRFLLGQFMKPFKGPAGRPPVTPVPGGSPKTPTPTGPQAKGPTILGPNGKPIVTPPPNTKPPGMGKNILNGGKNALKGAGKAFWPIAAAFALIDGADGFMNVDPDAGFFTKLGNGLQSALSGATFGLVGKSTQEQKAENISREQTRRKIATPTTAYSDFKLEDLKNMRAEMMSGDKQSREEYRTLVAKLLDESALKGTSTGGKGTRDEKAETFGDDSILSVRLALEKLIRLEEKNLKANKTTADNS